MSIQLLNISTDGDSTTSLGKLYQYLTTLTIKKCFLVFRQNFLLLISPDLLEILFQMQARILLAFFCHEGASLAHGLIVVQQVLLHKSPSQSASSVYWYLRLFLPRCRILHFPFSSIEPWGTSLVTCLQLDFVPLTTTPWAQLFRRFSFHLTIHLSNLYFVSLSTKLTTWSYGKSKALLKLRSTTSTAHLSFTKPHSPHFRWQCSWSSMISPS